MCDTRLILLINNGVWQQFSVIYMSYSDKYMCEVMSFGIEKVKL